MPRRSHLVIAALTLLAVVGGCARLQQTERPTVPLTFAQLESADKIPADYGRLVSVTSSDAFPGWAQLWFEKPDQSIVTVFVDFQHGSVRDKILVIPRS